MEDITYRGTELYCEELSALEIAATYGTPAYVYSRNSIVSHVRHFEAAFGGVEHLSCYAVKANTNLEVLRVLAAEGIGADAGSIGELHLALAAGFPPAKVTYSGVGKRDDEIEYALRHDILALNVESEEELDVIRSIAAHLGKKARILLRVNFDIEAGTHPYITTGSRQNKFGVEPARALEILSRARSLAEIDFLGIHSHIGSQIITSTAFIAAANAVLALVARIRALGIPVRQVNLGGGFGVQYRNYVRHPLLPVEENDEETGLTTAGMLREMLPMFSEAGGTLVLQPGRSLLAHAGILLTKVLYRKESGGKTFIVVDAGMNDLIRPSLYRSYHQIVPVSLREAPAETVDIVGPLCESGDFFAQDRKLPRVGRGDLLAVLCTGAYGYVLASNYNARPRPPEILVDGRAHGSIRSRETLDNL
jgi:diaminopimelate decarboxylase